MEIKIFSPAKLNIYLRVGQPEKGFHKILSLMHTIALFDEIIIRDGDSYSLECSKKDIPCDDSNLITRAVRFFSDYFLSGEMPKIKIYLKKRIPHQAGLGGGSSNAAEIIRYLCFHYDKKLDRKDMGIIAEKCGCDTPFFLTGGFALVKGFGEEVIPLDECLSHDLLLIKPKAGLNTGEIYREYDRITDNYPDMEECEASLYKNIISKKKFMLEDMQSWIINDLQHPAASISAPLGIIMDAIPQNHRNSTLLTGSGSCLFVLLDSSKPSESGEIIDSLPKNIIQKTVLTKFISMIKNVQPLKFRGIKNNT